MSSLLQLRLFAPTDKPFLADEPPFTWEPQMDNLSYRSADGFQSIVTSNGWLHTNKPDKNCWSQLVYRTNQPLNELRKVKMTASDHQLVCLWLSQFRSFGLGTDKFQYPGCRLADQGYFSYGGTKLPADWIPALKVILGKY